MHTKHTKQELIDIMLETWKQFAWRTYENDRPCLVPSGILALEQIRDVLLANGMINPKTGLPPRFPTDETTGFAPAAPWKGKTFQPKKGKGVQRQRTMGRMTFGKGSKS